MPRVKRCFQLFFFFKYSFFFVVNCNIATRVVSVFHNTYYTHFWITDSVRILSRRLDRLAETSRRFETVPINYTRSGGGDEETFSLVFFSLVSSSPSLSFVYAVKTYWNMVSTVSSRRIVRLDFNGDTKHELESNNTQTERVSADRLPIFRRGNPHNPRRFLPAVSGRFPVTLGARSPTRAE